MFKKIFPRKKNQERDEIARGLVSKFSRGSASLYFGRFATESEIEARRAKVLLHSFLEKS